VIPATQMVISASRRTDIPAFYMDWFMACIRKGYFEVTNPYNRKKSVVQVIPEKVDTIVFWSKNFGPFLEKKYGEILLGMGYHLFFNFTLNSYSPRLEPNVPPLGTRIQQLKALCDYYPVESIHWRFDPVCFYQCPESNMKMENNLTDFQMIAQTASRLGIRRCITSFMDDYAKIRKRTASIPGFAFLSPSSEKKKTVLIWMSEILKAEKIELHTCCEKEMLENLPVDTGIFQSACIPNDHLMKLYGGNLSLKKDTGQRTKKGCGCNISVDIGSYQQHPCYHNCLFCYANPSPENPNQRQPR